MNNSRSSVQESFYKLLITVSRDEERRNRLLPELGSYFHSLYEEFKEIDYPAIFSISYDEDIIREDLELLLQVLVEIEKQLSSDEEKRTIKKMRRHFLLSFEQKIRVREESEDTLRRAQSELTNVKNELVDTQDMLSIIHDDSAKVYAQFVAILGIFTAIVFSMFGGLKLLEFTLSALHSIEIWKAIVFFSMFAIATLCMLFILMRWISIIVDNVTLTKRRLKVGGILSSHFGFTVALVFFMYLMFIAALFSNKEVLSNFQLWIAGISNYLVLGFILLLPVLIFSLFLVVYIYNKKPTAPK